MKVNKCGDCKYAYQEQWVKDWIRICGTAGETSDLENAGACAKMGISINAEKKHAKKCPWSVKKGPVCWRNRLVERQGRS